MSFKAKVSIDSNGVKEERSVLFIQTLLLGRAKNNIDKGTTQSNIDGYIELLDSSNRINGKITVQVKTVSQKDEGHNRFPCPTSLFAYAEATTDNVFLLAVDHSQDKVLYKHISPKLLDENRDKEQQETITLHFKPNEELRKDNIEVVLKDWLSICSSRVYCLTHGEAILEENSELKSYLLNMPKMATDLRPCDIQAIQNFIDSYNKLLESDFRYIKSILFPNVWKRGIAIYTYSDSSLEYSLYNVNIGELVAPIVQMPKCSIFEVKHEHDYASFSCTENKLKENPNLYSISIIKKHVEDFIKKQRIIPSDEIFLVEYIHEFIETNWRHLHLEKYSELNVCSLIQHFQSKYPYIDKMPVHIVSGRKSLYVNTVYDAIKFLSEIGYTTIPYPYPAKGSYGNTGMVYDFYSPTTALDKSRIVIINTIRAYQNFIQSKFPLLANNLDAFYGGNLISVLVDYSNPGHKFMFYIHYFRSIIPSNEKIVIIEDISDSRIMKENSLSSVSDLFRKESVMFNGREFSCFRGGGLNDMTILFGRYNCWTHCLKHYLVPQLSIRCQGVSNLDWQKAIIQVYALKQYHSIPTALPMINVFILMPYPSC